MRGLEMVKAIAVNHCSSVRLLKGFSLSYRETSKSSRIDSFDNKGSSNSSSKESSISSNIPCLSTQERKNPLMSPDNAAFFIVLSLFLKRFSEVSSDKFVAYSAKPKFIKGS